MTGMFLFDVIRMFNFDWNIMNQKIDIPATFRSEHSWNVQILPYINI